MVSITLSVPAELKKDMDKFPELNWSAVAREAIKRKILLLKKFREFSKDSELTEEDSIVLGNKVNKNLSKKYKWDE